jgi:uncharacterized alpha-E superfamily protein
MISRVADHCFWFGRYVERAESTARLLQATRTLVFDADVPVTQCWTPLVIVSGAHPSFCEAHGKDKTGNGELVQEYMTWNLDNGVSLVRSVRAARESARVIRDVLAPEPWEEVNELFHYLGKRETRRAYDEHRESVYRTVRKSTQLTLGLVRSTMLHDEAMSFLWLGVMLERLGQTARLLDMHHHTMEREKAHDIVQIALWLSLLRAVSGAEAFMKKNQGRVSARALVSFLVFEARFPRSLRYCMRAARGLLSDVWSDPVEAERPSIERLDALLFWLDSQQASGIEGAGIHPLLTHVVDEAGAICAHVATEIQGPPRVPKSPPRMKQSQSQSQR